MIPIIFNQDESAFKKVDGLDLATLLAQDGIFFLKDVLPILGLRVAHIQKHMQRLEQNGANPYQVMGVRKVWSHWVVRMTVFASYYREHLVHCVRAVDPGWDSNQLLHQAGVFSLADVCRKLPFTAHQIRYQAKKIDDAKATMGVWKDTEQQRYLVDMRLFGPYIRELWQSQFGRWP